MSYKILVIDDDESILRLIKNILQLNDYDVTTRNGIEEVNICDFVDFDLSWNYHDTDYTSCYKGKAIMHSIKAIGN